MRLLMPAFLVAGLLLLGAGEERTGRAGDAGNAHPGQTRDAHAETATAADAAPLATVTVSPPLPSWEPVPQGTPLVLDVTLAVPDGAGPVRLLRGGRRWRVELRRVADGAGAGTAAAGGATGDGPPRSSPGALHGAGAALRLAPGAPTHLQVTVPGAALAEAGRHGFVLTLHARAHRRPVRLEAAPFQVWVVGPEAHLGPAARDHALLAAPRMHRLRGEALKAIQAAEKAHHAHPNVSAVLVLLGDLYAESGYYADALTALEEAAHGDPSNMDIVRRVAELAPRKGHQRKPRRMKDHAH